MTTETESRFEAHKLHYLTRAAEVMLYGEYKETAKDALGYPRNWQTLHNLARYIASHEPPPDPNAALLGLVEEVLKSNWANTAGATTLCLALIDRLRADGLLKEGV